MAALSGSSASAQDAGYSGGFFAQSGDGRFTLRAGAQFQFRYQATFDADAPVAGDDAHDDAAGFQYARTRLHLSGHLLDPRLTFGFLTNFDRTSGDLTLQDAIGEFKLTDAASVRFGQFKLPFDREQFATSPVHLLAAERSLAANAFRLDRAQGVQLKFTRDRWRAYGALSSGRRSANTGFYEAAEADVALTGRAEIRLGEASWDQWRDQTSFRSGKLGVLVGGGAHWQQEGSTGQAWADSLFAWTADLGIEGGGFNAMLTYSGRRLDTADEFVDHGFVVQGGVFVHDQAELFARWTMLTPDSDHAANDDFRTLSAGLNYYVIPESHAAKVTLEVAHAFDAQADSASLVGAPADGQALLPDASGSQTGVILQVQLMF